VAKRQRELISHNNSHQTHQCIVHDGSSENNALQVVVHVFEVAQAQPPDALVLGLRPLALPGARGNILQPLRAEAPAQFNRGVSEEGSTRSCNAMGVSVGFQYSLARAGQRARAVPVHTQLHVRQQVAHFLRGSIEGAK
jgi:hypothetical protein